MEKRYEPGVIEEKWLKRWSDARAWHGDAAKGGDPYCVLIPPPNITGILHMGHALNNTIQDILVRWRRMQGRNVVWMPGTDHAGIATQNVVERALRAEGKTRQDLGREAFVEKVWDWQKQYGSTIIRQLTRLGASCDWERERFTMDQGLSDAVSEVFVRLFDKGLIYKANYIINWCPRCHTALSDEESEHRETKGKLYHIRYPLTATEYVVVATTRPETLLGDVAVAVNPRDERHASLVGRTVRLPFLDRAIPVVADDFVDPAFGTGIVKVTPAHDPNDFELGRRHGLEAVNVMNGDGTMNEAAGPFAGLDRFACRKKILAELEAAGLIEKIDEHRHAVGHCYRCDTVVEPRLSPQWFVKMKPLAGPALEAVKTGRVAFVPSRWEKVYLDWMENIRDWCISRQIWWGHRIPVFTCGACSHVFAAKGIPGKCVRCGDGSLTQDPDVLDTWFSSWLWPFSTFGWPQKSADLSLYYPSHDLVTASEIIFFWVARMVMGGLEFMGDVPFRTVYIHGTVRDDKGRKMSKSLGNSIDPLTVIDKFSADALRFSLMMITATGQDVYLSDDKFEIGRNFGTKIWNAARFLKMQTERDGGVAIDAAAAAAGPVFAGGALRADDQHILAKLQDAVAACTESLGAYRFNDAARGLYEFVWHEFCDWYLESAKDVLFGQDEVARGQVLRISHHVLATALRLLHPQMPFITEEIWEAMGYGRPGELLMLARWPVAEPQDVQERWGIRRSEVEYVEQKHDLIRAGRMLRADYRIEPGRAVDYHIKPADEAAQSRLDADRSSLQTLLKAGRLEIDAGMDAPRRTPSTVSRLGTVFMPLDGLVDVEQERSRLSGQLAKAVEDRGRIEAKLQNVDFVNRAPADVVEQQRGRSRDLAELAVKLERMIATLSAG